MRNHLIASASLLALMSAPALADGTDDDRIAALEDRIEQLEEANRRLMDFLESQSASQTVSPTPSTDHDETGAAHAVRHAQHHDGHSVGHTDGHNGGDHGDHHSVQQADHHVAQARVQDGARSGAGGYVGLNSDYSYRILDHAENVNSRQLMQLRAIQDGELDNRVTLGGSIVALANYQSSNSDSKFGWLMRHPTSNNQIGEEVSELVVHSAQLQTTARFSDNLTGYVEFLYSPEQSFGAGSITALGRNLVQVRKAYVMWGNLDQSPWYASLGKMDTPFGLNDTVSPFTNSTVWHSFAGLAYGGMVGYADDNLHVRAMAIQGGAQFRAANSPVEGTTVPSRVNNFAVDANYTTKFENGTLMVGASYEHGSPYCQGYPVIHFNACQDNNPAYSVYSRLLLGELTLLGEYAQTTEVWPGSAVPDMTNPLSVFEAQETQSFTFGGRYNLDIGAASDLAVSLEFSRFRAGDEGAPWERQDQYVGGLSYFLTPSVNIFGELIHTDGWAPLNFVSGGNLPGGASWSERDAKSDILTFGIQAAF
jgi:hypothetical protein